MTPLTCTLVQELVLGRELEAQLEAVSAVPLTVVPSIPVHALPRPRTETPGPRPASPPHLTTAHLAAVMEEANGLGLHQRPKTIQKPDDVFY